MDKILREVKKDHGNRATYFGKLEIGDVFCFNLYQVLEERTHIYKRKISSNHCCYVQRKESIEEICEDMIVYQVKEE